MKIGFFVPTVVPSHNVSCLMQGFHALGWEVYTNAHVEDGRHSRGISTPFRQTAPDYLHQVGNDELLHDLLVVDAAYGYGNNFENLRRLSETRPVIILNMEDTTNFFDYPESFVVFTAHFNRLAIRQGRIFPLGIGLSDDLIQLSNSVDLTHKKNVIVRNFNATFSQSVRNALDLMLVEGLERHFEVDRRITDPTGYLKQLSEASVVCAYGGEFLPDLWGNPYLRQRWEQDGSTTYKFKVMGASPVVLRWDSWRYFEAAVMACAPIQLDFEKYGFILPVNPEPWVHYIPVDLTAASNLPSHLADLVRQDPDFLIRIGRNARQWILNYYSPRRQAEYVMSVVRGFFPCCC